MTDRNTKPRFYSEELEPFAALVTGRFFARVMWEKEHGDTLSVQRECDTMWYAVQALDRLSIATDHGEDGAIHFALAAGNNVTACADIIESITGVRPEESD